MPVPSLSSVFAAAVTAMLLGLTAPAAATTTAPEPELGSSESGTGRVSDPLRITLTELSPAVLPKRGRIQITGRVRNVDDVTWTDINVYPFMGSSPMTSATELLTAAESDPRGFSGRRIIQEGAFAAIESLAPGESARFSIRIPRSDLPAPDDAAGVYWFGVHALGSSPDGRDELADGRARTFLPAVARPRRDRASAAVVVPIRRDTTRAADGSIAHQERWAAELAPGGRLANLLELAERADLPLTWLVDPAVPEAVARLAAGNPPRELGPPQTPDPSPDGEPTGSASTDVTTGPEGTAETTPGAGSSTGDDPAGTDTGTTGTIFGDGDTWTTRLLAALADAAVLGLPYGDLDSNAAARYDAGLAERARAAAGAAFDRFGWETTPVLAPPDGYLTQSAIESAEAGEELLVTDALLGSAAAGAARVLLGGQSMWVAGSAVATGGPAPGNRTSAFAVRQRLLAEAALRVGDEDAPPLIVSLPANWDPGTAPERFLDGLDQPWLELRALPELGSIPATTVDSAELARRPRAPGASLGADNFAALTDLLEVTSTFDAVLTESESLPEQVLTGALADLSWLSAERPAAARRSILDTTRWLRHQMSSVTVEAPSYVTLTSNSGRLPVTVANGLDHPVTVHLSTSADSPVTVEDSGEITLGPGARTSILVNAGATRIGVHTVEFRLTDAEGRLLGSTSEVRVRSVRVSVIIWYVIAGGALLLFGAIVVRIVRRVRGGPAGRPKPDEPQPDEPKPDGPGPEQSGPEQSGPEETGPGGFGR